VRRRAKCDVARSAKHSLPLSLQAPIAQLLNADADHTAPARSVSEAVVGETGFRWSDL